MVFTTSLHDRASRIRAKEAGADDFLVKPIDGLELLVRVERLLRVRAQTELIYAERDRLARRAEQGARVRACTPLARLWHARTDISAALELESRARTPGG